MKKVKVFTVKTPIGPVKGAVSANRLVVLSLRQKDPEHFARQIRRRVPDAVLEEVPPESTKAGRELADYFAGKPCRLEAAVDLSGLSEFSRQVLGATKAIKYGQTKTYGQIAAQIGKPQAARAVGRALGANPVALFVPCHRVLGADGSLTGFGSGVDIKKRLLNMEKKGARK